MHKRLISAIHMLNIVFQALYTLILPVGIGALASFLLTKYHIVDRWIWALLLTLGFIVGLISMIKYTLTATKNLQLLEKQQEENAAAREAKERRQAELRELSKEKEVEQNGSGEDGLR